MRAYTRFVRLFVLCCVCAGWSAWLAGCESASTSPVAHSQEKSSAKTGEQKKPRTYAIVYSTADLFYKEITRHAEAASRQLGAQLIVKAPDEANLEQQIRMMENLIKQRVDGIAISPVDEAQLTPYINKAVEAGIKVICFENDAPLSGRTSYIGLDHYEAGRKLARYTAELLGGHGMIIAETGMFSFSNIQQRAAGFRDYLSRVPDIQLLELRTDGDNTDRAVANLEQMINAHPHFDAFVGLDSMAGSAGIMVWKAKGLHQFVVAFNETEELLAGVKNEQVTAVMSQHERFWGELIVGELNDVCSGKTIRETTKLDPVFITKDNLEFYMAESLSQP